MDRFAPKSVASIRSQIQRGSHSQEYFNKYSIDVSDQEYIKYALTPGEEITYEAGLHWSIMLWPLILCILFLSEPPFMLFSTIWLIIALVNYITSELVITNKRLSLQTGVVTRRAFEADLKDIQLIEVEQGAIGRILGYGTLVVIGPNGDKYRFSCVSEPFEFKKRVQIRTTDTAAGETST